MRAVFRFSLPAFIAFLAFSPAPAAARPLTPADVLRITYRSSLASRMEDANVELASEDVRSALSQYDTALRSGISYTSDESARSSLIFGSESTKADFSAGASQLAPSGTLVDLSLDKTRESSDSAFMTMDPVFEARATLSVTQPLLNDYFGYATRARVAAARTLEESAVEKREANRQKLAYKNLALFWKWYLKVHLAGIQREAVGLAGKNLEINREKLSLGLIERDDLYAFAANLDTQKHALLAIEEEIARLENDVRYALSLPADPISPSAGTLPVFSGARSLDALLAEALAHQPILKTLREDLKAQDIVVAVRKNSRLPRLDLKSSLALNGLDDDGGTALEDVGDGHPVWMTGLSATFPIPNRLARSEYGRTESARRRKLLALEDAENKITSLVRQAFERRRKALEKERVAMSLVGHQRLKWESEITRYNQGRSAPDTVIRFQDEYLNARKVHLEAKVGAESAGLELLYAAGRLRDETPYIPRPKTRSSDLSAPEDS